VRDSFNNGKPGSTSSNLYWSVDLYLKGVLVKAKVKAEKETKQTAI